MVTPQTPPKVIWKDPYYPRHGHSPLRNEYKILRISEADSYITASGAAAHHNLSADQEDPEEYDPEYATHLVATMQSQAEKKEMAWRKEYEEFYRIENILDREPGWNDRLALALSQRRLRDAIESYVSGEKSMGNGSESGWERDRRKDTELRMGKGTRGTEGHRRMKKYLEGGGLKRKRGVEDEGEVGGLGKKVQRSW
ncbi:hypothetical protein PTT_07491 [Pyrenophora teres f. teres 0-1]|uniref:Uncharacterized protein n=1 Tax=Pyrenophora teres f. teres (strain 0-1) TaxID=861557 RepID=E3RHS0_PYRTT|nr:hypothetical protein PTT_07491 [Pyrenophora teres f. teres 0-1]